MTIRTVAAPRVEKFRHVLRRKTRAAHDAAERNFERFLTAPVDNMEWFLAIQRAALSGFMQARKPDDRILSGIVLEDLVERLDFDLTRLNLRPMTVVADRQMSGMAIDYLVLGSRLGTEVLRRRISEHLPANEIPTYFLAGSDPKLWGRLCDALDEIDPDGATAQRIWEDAEMGFGLFVQATELQEDQRGLSA